MSNETMPEKIWASGENGNGWWERNLGGKPYIRTDTIPSRAQVARTFMESVFRSHTNANFKLPVAETMDIVLKEWEEADR